MPRAAFQMRMADLNRIFAIDEPFVLNEVGVQRLEAVLMRVRPKLVIIDPLFSYAGRIDINRDKEVRKVTRELARLAETYECAIIAIRHLGKSKGLGDARSAGLNGIGWRASSRSVLLAGRDPNNKDSSAIVLTKSNLGPSKARAIAYKIEDGKISWAGESSLTAETILSFPENEETRVIKTESIEFLRQALAEGERAVAEVLDEAKEHGITPKQLRTAGTKIGILRRREGFAKGWLWKLPNSA